MSNGERDQGPQGKAATQDVYARVASAAASRSGNGAGPGPSVGAGTAPSRVTDDASATSPARANENPFPSRAAVDTPSPAAPGSAPARKADATDAPATGSNESIGKSWKDRLNSLTQRVTGTDETAASTSDPTSPAASSGAAAGGTKTGGTKTGGTKTGVTKTGVTKTGVTKTGVTRASSAKAVAPTKPSHAADDRSATEPTTVVGTPVAAPTARVTGARAATPVVVPATGKPAKAGDSETLDTDKPKAGTARRTRKARLRLSRLDPWSVMKTAFMFSIAGGIMLVVGVYAIWAVISGSGLFDNVNEIIASVVSTPGDTTPFRVEDYVNTAKVMGVTAFLACIDVVIFTALATLGAFLYNLAATMLGGLEITLAED